MDQGKAEGVRGPFADLYDVFVDWPGRLGRETPGLIARLTAARARRVLDAGCGTGRHVRALIEAGFDACGADASPDMLAKAREHAGEAALFEWRMGSEPPADLRARAPFDAITCLGNVWSSMRDDAQVDATLAGFRSLLAPGGLVLVGLKAVAVRRETKSPYLPLLRRERDGDVLFFVRFLDFDAPQAAPDLCEVHVAVLRGDARAPETDAPIHDVRRWRVWSPETLSASFSAGGFDARVSATLGDPGVAPRGEDVFVHATLRGSAQARPEGGTDPAADSGWPAAAGKP